MSCLNRYSMGFGFYFLWSSGDIVKCKDQIDLQEAGCGGVD